jgi:hypothetical protein
VDVDPCEPLNELTADQLIAFCDQVVAEYPPKTVTCDASVVTVGENTSACRLALSHVGSGCTATVAEEQDCLIATYDAPCDFSSDTLQACDPVEDCQGDGD